MPDEGATKSTKQTQIEIDTKIKYTVTVLNELEKSVREVIKKRLVHDQDEMWQ